MKINYISDLHLECVELAFGDETIAGLRREVLGDVLVLAGDITVKNRVEWINQIAKQVDHIIYVLGNHEFYHNNLDSVYNKTKKRLDDNVHLLQNESVILNGTTFHGTTLWTDFNQGNPISYMQCKNAINDFRLIRADNGTSRFTPQRAHKEHRVARDFLANNVKRGDVVVTHMAPTMLSIHKKYCDDLHINGSYASDLSELILDTNPALWFHGHMHDSFDYMVGDTHVLCNPLGYVDRMININPKFDYNANINIRSKIL